MRLPSKKCFNQGLRETARIEGEVSIELVELRVHWRNPKCPPRCLGK